VNVRSRTRQILARRSEELSRNSNWHYLSHIDDARRFSRKRRGERRFEVGENLMGKVCRAPRKVSVDTRFNATPRAPLLQL
jgi:hypothetical protein